MVEEGRDCSFDTLALMLLAWQGAVLSCYSFSNHCLYFNKIRDFHLPKIMQLHLGIAGATGKKNWESPKATQLFLCHQIGVPSIGVLSRTFLYFTVLELLTHFLMVIFAYVFLFLLHFVLCRAYPLLYGAVMPTFCEVLQPINPRIVHPSVVALYIFMYRCVVACKH